jgi:hypothetical protein
MNADLECPYCNAALEVCHDDGFGYEEDRTHEMECPECEKNFVFHTAIHFSYRPAKADCLNGSPHRFRDWVRLWLDAGRDTACYGRRCADCGHEERETRKSSEANTTVEARDL